jgi:biotin operon repressor
MSTHIGRMEQALHAHISSLRKKGLNHRGKRKTFHVLKQEAQRWHSKTAQSNRLSGIG